MALGTFTSTSDVDTKTNATIFDIFEERPDRVTLSYELDDVEKSSGRIVLNGTFNTTAHTGTVLSVDIYANISGTLTLIGSIAPSPEYNALAEFYQTAAAHDWKAFLSYLLRGDDNIFLGDNADTVEGLTGIDALFGGGGVDTLYGGAADDFLDGGTGNDVLLGGDGKDTYSVDSTNDVIIELAGEGVDDTVLSVVNYTLSAEVERLTLNGSANLTGTGNGGANVLTGNDGNNVLSALAGNDTASGGVGNDTIYGGIGNDLVEGGDGNDTLYGDAGTDSIDGGAGTGDVAVFAGASSSYFAAEGGGAFTLTGTDGTDVITGVEFFRFTDGTLTAAQVSNLNDIESAGSTGLTRSATGYFFEPSNTTLKYQGTAVVAGQFGAWVPIGAEAVAGGSYDVVWKFGSADQYVIWRVNSSGNMVSIGPTLTGNSYALQELETTFSQNLNGDGTTGLTTTTIESSGGTNLIARADRYFLGAAGPSVKYEGTDVSAGQFGAWVPIGAEAAGGGNFDVVWKFGSSDQYIVWRVNSSGNLVSIGPTLTGSNYALQALETTFSQNLNGDGTTGFVTTTIESSGGTNLLSRADRYFLGSAGPSIKYEGADVVAGQFGAWVPIGAEAVAGGNFDIVWKFGSANQYIVWRVNSSGNMVSIGPTLTSSNYALQELETTFSQNLNGDGTTGLTTTTIESSGGTNLLSRADRYFLGSAGPAMKYEGTEVTAGQFGAWVPIGAEAVPGGDYDVVWKFGSADQYIVWRTNSSGNLTSMGPILSGNSTELLVLETIFNQNLNSTGGIGVSLTQIEGAGATELNSGANRYFFETGSTVGPTLKYLGADVLAGQFGAWNPLGAEAVGGGGYDVAWRFGSADQYIVWRTNSAGDMTSIGPTLTGNSYALQQLEVTFNQNLNGDGTTGFVNTTIESSGSTSLILRADRYFLGSGGPSVKYEGTDVSAGQFGAWTPIGAEPAGGGSFDVVWRFGSADQYIVWRVNSSGNLTSMGPVLSGGNYALQALETTFSQNLNGDGTTGFTTTTIEDDGLTTLLSRADRYFLGSAGPAVKYEGTEVSAGQFGAWAPIGAEAVSGGNFDVVWKFGSADQYIVWRVNSSGNLTSMGPVVSGNSPTIQALEPTFDQDLNGNGFIG